MIEFLKDFAWQMLTLIPKALFELALLGIFVVLTALRYAHQQLDTLVVVRAIPEAAVVCDRPPLVRKRTVSESSDRSFNSDAGEQLFASYRRKWR